MTQESIERREMNRQRSLDLLEKHSITFESKNDGAHLIVTHNKHVIDFWPGTGKFIPRGTTKTGRGVFNLLNYLGVEHA